MKRTSTDKKSFVLYNDYFEHIEDLDNQEKAWLLDSIFLYASKRSLTEPPSKTVKMAFSFIKKQMDRDFDKYDKFIEKQRENGKKGGRPKGSFKKPENPTVILETQKSLTDTVTVNETDNDNGIHVKNDFDLNKVDLDDFPF